MFSSFIRTFDSLKASLLTRSQRLLTFQGRFSAIVNAWHDFTGKAPTDGMKRVFCFYIVAFAVNSHVVGHGYNSTTVVCLGLGCGTSCPCANSISSLIALQ